MPTDPKVNLARFSKVVKRALDEARDRGMTDPDIEKATGVRASTFHRWRRAEVAPQIAKVNAFFDGLGVPRRAAHLALGVAEGRDEPEPEPAIDPEVRRILRLLADPSISDEDKNAIRAMLRVIGPRSTRTKS